MSSIVIQGDTSGSITVEAPSVAGTHTLTLPKATGTVATNATVGLGTKNLIINGDMQIAQRGTSVTGITASGYASLDRWYVLEGTDGTYTMSQDTDVPSGQGFSNSLKMAVTTADTNLTGTQSLRLWQKIEGQNLQHLKFGTSSAESFTLSFWIKSKTTGNFVVRILNVDANRHICKLVSIDSADTWEKKTLTFVGDTTGSIDNDNGDSFRVDIWFSAGPDVSSGTLPTTWATNNTANSGAGQTIDLASSTSNYINITGVQLEVGTEATPFENRMYSTELAMCQRYYEKSYAMATSPGTNTVIGLCQTLNGADGNQVAGIRFIVPKRATPTGKFWSKDGTASSLSTTSHVNAPNAGSWSNMYDTNEFGFRCIVGTGGLSSGTAYCWHYTAEAEL